MKPFDRPILVWTRERTIVAVWAVLGCDVQRWRIAEGARA
jgi:hypothetical protein